MDESSFGKCKLSTYALDKIAELKHKGLLKPQSPHRKKLWKIVAGEYVEKDENKNEENSSEEVQGPNSTFRSESVATQFHFTQMVQNTSLNQSFGTARTQFSERPTETRDIDTILLESLARNEKVDWTILDNVPSEEVSEVIDSLGEKITMTGIRSLCSAMCFMNTEQKIKYFSLLCSKIILHKLAEEEKPSRSLFITLGDLIRKYPDDVQKWIFVPLLNFDMKNATLVETLIETFGTKRTALLFSDFVRHANEIKEWHLSFLESFKSVKLEDKSKEILIKMLLEKTTVFSKNLSYGSFVLGFCKSSGPFLQNELDMLREIAAVHGTMRKKAMENVLKNM